MINRRETSDARPVRRAPLDQATSAQRPISLPTSGTVDDKRHLTAARGFSPMESGDGRLANPMTIK